MKKYEAPMLEIEDFSSDDVIIASAGPHFKTKNPGYHHFDDPCTVMPNGDPIPENAVGYWKDK